MIGSKFFHNSIRVKIFILYVIVLSAALTIFSAIIYVDYQDTLKKKVDSLLDAKVQTVQSSVYAFWRAQAGKGVEDQKATNWFQDLFGGEKKQESPQTPPIDPYEMIIRYLSTDTKYLQASDSEIFVDIFDVQGRLTDSTQTNAGLSQLNPMVLREAMSGKRVFHHVYVPADGKKNSQLKMRAAVLAVTENGKPSGIVQARVSLKFISDRLWALILQLFIRGLIVVGIASWGSMFLVLYTLRPVDLMAQRIREIKQDNLHERIAIPPTRDEIARLAETFNDMLQRLEKSFSAQKQIVQDISHDLKIPLTVIQGQIDVILKKERSAEEYRETLYSSLEEIQRVKLIIDNLLALARFDDPNYALVMSDVNLNKLLENIAQDIQILGMTKQLRVALVSPETVNVLGHKMSLDRLFRNLMENAVKYNVPQGRVEITLKKSPEGARVLIQDTGVGMPKAELGKIFDRFYRVDRVRSSSEGFGLGLSIAKSIVEAHHGAILVDSEVGKGTSFEVQLPIQGFGPKPTLRL